MSESVRILTALRDRLDGERQQVLDDIHAAEARLSAIEAELADCQLALSVLAGDDPVPVVSFAPEPAPEKPPAFAADGLKLLAETRAKNETPAPAKAAVKANPFAAPSAAPAPDSDAAAIAAAVAAGKVTRPADDAPDVDAVLNAARRGGAVIVPLPLNPAFTAFLLDGRRRIGRVELLARANGERAKEGAAPWPAHAILWERRQVEAPPSGMPGKARRQLTPAQIEALRRNAAKARAAKASAKSNGRAPA